MDLKLKKAISRADELAAVFFIFFKKNNLFFNFYLGRRSKGKIR